MYQALQRFTVLDLSNFYLDVAKDRLYISSPSASDRRACQTVLAALLEGMLPLIAPLLPHMAEDAWQNLPYQQSQQSGVRAGGGGARGDVEAGGAGGGGVGRAAGEVEEKGLPPAGAGAGLCAAARSPYTALSPPPGSPAGQRAGSACLPSVML